MNELIVWLQNKPGVLFYSAFFLFLVMIFLAFRLGMIITRIKMNDIIKKAREDAVNRSKAVIAGQAGEQVAAFLPEFPCNPADCRFVGKPVDFIAFPGACGEDSIKEILLIEVKTGASQLSRREKEIRECVEQGRIRYIEYRIDLD